MHNPNPTEGSSTYSLYSVAANPKGLVILLHCPSHPWSMVGHIGKNLKTLPLHQNISISVHDTSGSSEVALPLLRQKNQTTRLGQ